jgi:hypothetical protein
MQGNLDLGVTSVGITFGTSGTDINASGSPVTSSGNITINLPTASATNRGALSSADWTTFNSKQGAITLTTTGTSGASTLVGNTLNIPNYTTDLSGYVTLGTAQTITAQKTFTTSGSSDTMIISHGSGSGFALDVIKAGNGEAIRVQKTSGSGNAMTISGGNFEAGTIVKTGGTSTQYLMADGSVSTLTNPVTGTGTAGRVALWNGTNSINSDSDFTYNSSTNLLTIGGGITLTGAQTIQTSTGNLTLATAGGNGNILLTPNGTGKVGIGTITPEGSGLTVASGGILVSLDPGVDRKVLELYATSTGAKVSSTYVGSSSYGSLELLTSNVARLTIASTGAATFSAGVGINSEDFRLRPNGDVTDSPALVLKSPSAGVLSLCAEVIGVPFADSNSLSLRVSNVASGRFDALTVLPSGNVGIGTASPANKLHLVGDVATPSLRLGSVSVGFHWDIGRENASTGDFVFNNTVSGGSSTERMRITADGQVLVGMTSNGGSSVTSVRAGLLSGQRTASADECLSGWNQATSGDNKFAAFYTEANGTLRGTIDYNRAAGLVRYNVTSDKNLKNIIGDSDGKKSIEILNSTRIREYSWKEDESNKSQIGVIAQELFETYKGAVSVGSDEELLGTENYKPWGVDKTAFTFHLVAGFQEHERIIKELQAQIDSLKNQIK